MICSIHQPNYIPYLGLFHKVNQSDIFVFYDTAQYTKGDYHNRNTIKGSSGPILLSLPVSVQLGMQINEVTFDSRVLSKHWKTIETNYKKAPYFEQYNEFFADVFSYQGNSIAEFNMQTIESISRLLGIKTRFVKLSKVLPVLESKSTEALVDICKAVNSNVYISGAGGRDYVIREMFEEEGIELKFQEFHHPTYHQLWGEFIPYMSIVDLILNEGPNSFKFIS